MSGLRSAGLLPFRIRDGLEVLLAHPGGPYFARRDDGWWSLVKGLVKMGESDEDAARREFNEETGWPVPDGLWTPLGETRLKSRKIVVAWALEADLEPSALVPGHFLMGDRSYPEIDRVDWFNTGRARAKLNPAQGVFVERLELHLQDLTDIRKD
ncbi:MAG: NUDIX domain-containing protein [Acidimicrobiia bacterium]